MVNLELIMLIEIDMVVDRPVEILVTASFGPNGVCCIRAIDGNGEKIELSPEERKEAEDLIFEAAAEQQAMENN